MAYKLRLEYQFFDLNSKKYGKKLYIQRKYSTKQNALSYANKIKLMKQKEFKKYNAQPRKFKTIITK